MDNYCPITYTLLEELTADTLKFKSIKTGFIYDSKPENTLLASESNVYNGLNKYKNTMKTAAFDPVNPRVELPEGCPSCKRKVVSMQRLGPQKKVVYSCICSYQFN